MATDNLRGAAQVAVHQAVQRQVCGAIGRLVPEEGRAQRGAQALVQRGVAFQQIQARRQAGDAMHENADVQLRPPRQHIPGWDLRARQQVIEHSVKGLGRDGGLPIEGQAAAALADQEAARMSSPEESDGTGVNSR